MRIVVDMQGAQARHAKFESTCYTTQLTRSLIRHAGEHEVVLVLSNLFDGTIEAIRAKFQDDLPASAIRVWSAPGPVAFNGGESEGRARAARVMREMFLADLKPDLVVVPDLLDGRETSITFSVGAAAQSVPTVVVLHSLSDTDAAVQGANGIGRTQRVQQIRRADHVLILPPLEVASSALALGIPTTRIGLLTQAFASSEQADACADDAAVILKLLDVKPTPVRGTPISRPKLAYVSPLPPQRSGIAGYSAELLPELSHHYDIDVVTGHPDVSDPWVAANCQLRTVEWFRQNAARYDRVLYHFGNNPMHAFMFGLLDEIPGVVVLHDFYLSDIQWYCQVYGVKPDAWIRELYQSHGFKAVAEFNRDGVQGTLSGYPGSLGVINKALGVIVHSEHSLELARRWYGDMPRGVVIPLLRTPAVSLDKLQARAVLGLAADDFVVCSFGFMGRTKLNHRLLDAWEASTTLRQDAKCKLFFVGQNEESDYGSGITSYLKERNERSSVSVTGWTDADTYELYLAAADVGVQLRELSRGETSAAVLDCLNHGLATIVNANGAMADLPDQVLIKLPDHFADAQLVDSLETLRNDLELCRNLGSLGEEFVHIEHAPPRCAELYVEHIEAYYLERSRYIQAISAIGSLLTDHGGLDILSTSKSVALNQPAPAGKPRIYVDVSAMARVDLRTGIQRVVRALLLSLIESPPAGYLCEPIFLCNSTGAWEWRYARNFTLELMGNPSGWLDDDIVEMHPGEQFLGLDFSGSYVVEGGKAKVFERMRERGVKTTFVVYDLIPILFEEHFPDGIKAGHAQWLHEVSKADSALCISAAVAQDLRDWIAEHGAERGARKPMDIGWFHLGADLASSVPTAGLPADSAKVLERLSSVPSFLSVGTIEPRKGHAQTLAAFNLLWEQGEDVNLVLVGKQGWMVDSLASSLRDHPERGKRLFWLEGISDEYLEKLYAASACLLAASQGEGFGLPLIEAAQHKLPILARSLPVFLEVAGNHATYFAGDSAESLATALQEWVRSHHAGTTIRSDAMPWMTWQESAEQLKISLKACGRQRISKLKHLENA